MDASLDNFKKKFIEEAFDLINELEKSVLDLEENRTASDLVQRIFRIMHTLKGNSSMFGFEQIDRFTHQMETIYDLVRSGEREVNDAVLEMTLKSVDHLKRLLDEAGDESQELMEEQEALVAQMDAIITDTHEPKTQLGETVSPSKADETSAATTPLREEKSKSLTRAKKSVALGEDAETFYIHFSPVSDIFNNGTNPLYLIDELHSLGHVRVRANLERTPTLNEIEPSYCYTSWDAVLVTNHGQHAINDVFIFVENESDLEIVLLERGNLLENLAFTGKLELLWTSNEEVNSERMRAIVPMHIAHPDDALAATRNTTGKNVAISSIRVASEKLDELMNLVSELVTSQARLSLFAEEQNLPGLTAISENVQKLSRQLRDIAFSIVLIPIENLLTRFHRLVRDISKSLGKEVRFITEGSETELDKTIIEGLADPLMHILRNSLDHGIEDPDIRRKLGKPAEGTIRLKAFYSGTNVMIQVSDDGAGIDLNMIHAKAVERALITPDRKLTKRETLDLIFLPGFSTSKMVTELSGRGVGMDVVKRKISELRGEVEIDSERGIGTTITIKLPLTLSIIDGLLVRVDETSYVIPLSSVDKIYAVEHSKVVNQFNDVVVLDGVQVPFFNLRKEFDLPESTESMEQVIVVNFEGIKVGFVVDTVIGEYQAVLKPLGRHYKNQDMISGATILGNGTVALVIDTNRIIKFFANREDLLSAQNEREEDKQ